MRLLDELGEHGVGLFAGASALRIEPGTVHFTDRAGAMRAIDADHVIVAKGASGDLGFGEQLRAEGFAVHTVGDCEGVAYIEAPCAVPPPASTRSWRPDVVMV